MQSGTISQAVVEEKALDWVNTTRENTLKDVATGHVVWSPSFFSSAATMASPGCGDQYTGLAEGNGDKESIDRSLEPPVYMLVSLVKHTC